ncbi:MAG: energy transducer TonB [Wenzhouxiangella sp.]
MSQLRQSSAGADGLAMAIAVAAGLHVAVIGLVHFEFLGDRLQAVSPSLDIIMVDWTRSEVPEEADFLAQVSQLGGGDSLDSGLPAQPIAPEPMVAEPELPQPAAEANDAAAVVDAVVSTETALEAVPMDPETAEADPLQGLDPRQLREQSLAMVRSPQLHRETSDFRQQPRRKFISAATREHLFASYMSAWIAKVERIGNMNYPEAARRQGIEGSLVLSVDILADGSVDEIRVLRSSGHELLDEAAIRIVRLSSPFAPLPPEITEQVDILTITRTWQFSTAGGLR